MPSKNPRARSKSKSRTPRVRSKSRCATCQAQRAQSRRKSLKGTRRHTPRTYYGRLKKYSERPSPPLPANRYCGAVRKGNDGRMYKSVENVRGICQWKPVSKSS